MPGYVELCVETVRRYHPEVRVLDRAAFDALWEVDRDVPIDHLSAPHRADFVRVYLLHHHGGLWLDSDFVLLRPLDELAELPPEITFAGYRIDGGDFTNNLMFSRPGDPVLRDFYARVCEHLREWRPISWLEIGAYALKEAVDAHPGAVFEVRADLVCPIPWHQAQRFEAAGAAEALASPSRWGVMLSNNSVSQELRGKSRETVLQEGSVLGDLLRRALAP
jgi:hypothetical protein